MNRFLASVRDLREAQLALAAGADWIDLKEPEDGALGAVDVEMMRKVVEWATLACPNVPISATIGDLWQTPELMPERVDAVAQTGVDYIKIGVFACDIRHEFLSSLAHCLHRFPKIIMVCFAESLPRRADIAAIADVGVIGVMLDTAQKSAGRLTTVVSQSGLEQFVESAKGHGILCGLAGSLSLRDIPNLAALNADYLGFRGALCDGAVRQASLDFAATRRIRDALDHHVRRKLVEQPISV